MDATWEQVYNKTNDIIMLCFHPLHPFILNRCNLHKLEKFIAKYKLHMITNTMNVIQYQIYVHQFFGQK